MIAADSCTIQWLPSRTLDDGFDKLTEPEKMSFTRHYDSKPWAGMVSDVQQEVSTAYGYQRTCREWRPEELVSIARQHRLTWLLLVSSWCPHARNDVVRWQELQDRLRQSDIASVVLSTDYDVSYLTNVLPPDTGFSYAGIASIGDYHDDQLEKCNRFQRALFPACPPSAGIPRHYLLDSTGSLITWHFGELVDPGRFLNAEELE